MIDSARSRLSKRKIHPKEFEINGRVVAAPFPNEDYPGASANRVCRDIIFLVLLIAFCVFGIGFLIYLTTTSDVVRLVQGADEYGNVCGRNNPKYFNLAESGKDFTDKPLKYVSSTDLASAAFTGISGGQCVSGCPNGSSQFLLTCVADDPVSTATDPANQLINQAFGSENFFQELASDLNKGWPIIVGLCAIALVFSLIITALLRFLAPIIVWITVAIIILAFLALTIYVWVIWYLKGQELDAMSADDINRIQAEKDKSNLLIAGIVCAIVTFLVIVLIIALRKRIKLVIQLFVEAGKAIAAMPLLLIQPIWTCISLLIFCLCWIIGSILIEASGEPKLILKLYVKFQLSEFLVGMKLYHVFAFFWLTQFIIGCQHVTIAGAVAKWFFTRDKKNLGWPILTSLKNLIRYSLGSVAFGSLIIAIIQMIRYLLAKAQKNLGNRNPCVSGILKCCQCFMACFEKIIKFITRNAYIQIAIYGYGFCKSAQKAFSVLSKNALRVTAINFVGAFVLFLAKVAVVVSVVFIGIEITKASTFITHKWILVAIGAIFSFLIVHCFVSVYEMTIDTLFICFCEDCEMNDGLQKPYFMSKGLMKFVENSSKALEALEARKYEKPNAWAQQVQPIQQVQPGQISRVNSNMLLQPSPRHRVNNIEEPDPLNSSGMSPLHALYPPRSMPPSPSKLVPPHM